MANEKVVKGIVVEDKLYKIDYKSLANKPNFEERIIQLENKVQKLMDLYIHSFRIGGTAYFIFNTMTWREWVNSDFNTDQLFEINELNRIQQKTTGDFVTHPDTNALVEPEEMISPARNYNLVHLEIGQFSLANDLYEREAGMVWEEWINSPYNINNRFAIGELGKIIDTTTNYAVVQENNLNLDDPCVRFYEIINSDVYLTRAIMMFSFEFQNQSYMTEENTTWEEWINSPRNTIGLYIDNYGLIRLPNYSGSYRLCTDFGVAVGKDDIMVADDYFMDNSPS